MPDSEVVEPARSRPARRTLTYLTVPIVVLVILNNVGDGLAPSLVKSHPLLLIAMNARNRNLLLVTNKLGAFGYYGIGTLRLAIPDPLFFLLGYWYGDRAMEWMERRTRTLGKAMRQWEQWFGKAAYPLVFLASNNPICLFAGAAEMSIPGFIVADLTGTLARLYALRWLGKAFNAPIDDVLRFISDHRTPLLVVSIGLAAVVMAAEYRGGGPGLEALADDPAPPPAPDPHPQPDEQDR